MTRNCAAAAFRSAAGSVTGQNLTPRPHGRPPGPGVPSFVFPAGSRIFGGPGPAPIQPTAGRPQSGRTAGFGRRRALPAASSFCPRSLIELSWSRSSVVRSTTRDAGDPGSNPALPVGLPDRCPRNSYANICYQEALDWRKWTRGVCSFLFLSAQF